MKVMQSFSQLVGNTPLYEPRCWCEARCCPKLLVKLECMEPAGSIKDRTALWLIRDAERRGALKPGGTIIEPTSGNTGIGLAAVAAASGYRVILTMPDSMSAERRRLLAALGAELVLTDGARGMAAAVERAEELAAKTEGSFIPGQFSNQAGALAHFESTGPEIWADCEGQVDIFVATVGTGGTLSGTGRYLKQQKPSLRVVAVEPASSPLLSEGRSGPHGIQGIGANFVPEVLDRELIDEIITIGDEQALEAAREFARREGLLVGISSGAALAAAEIIAKRRENAGKLAVTVAPDSGSRYLSGPLYGD